MDDSAALGAYQKETEDVREKVSNISDYKAEESKEGAKR